MTTQKPIKPVIEQGKPNQEYEKDCDPNGSITLGLICLILIPFVYVFKLIKKWWG